MVSRKKSRTQKNGNIGGWFTIVFLTLTTSHQAHICNMFLFFIDQILIPPTSTSFMLLISTPVAVNPRVLD